MRDRADRVAGEFVLLPTEADAVMRQAADEFMRAAMERRTGGVFKFQVTDLYRAMVEAKLHATSPADEAAALRAIAGALKSAIAAHGPITPEQIGSAAKRIYALLTRPADHSPKAGS